MKAPFKYLTNTRHSLLINAFLALSVGCSSVALENIPINRTKIQTLIPVSRRPAGRRPSPAKIKEPPSMPFDDPWQQALKASIAYQHSELLSLIAKKVGVRRNGHGLCLRYFRVTMTNLKRAVYRNKRIELLNFHDLPSDRKKRRRRYSPGRSAEDFRQWALGNPISMCHELGLANVTGLVEANSEKGFVHVFSKGKCGFHRVYGHIEVLTDARKQVACSDHCRIVHSRCKPSLVLAPVSSCNWLVLNADSSSDIALVQSTPSSTSASPRSLVPPVFLTHERG